MGDGNGKVDVTHALAADTTQADFHAATVANDVLVLDALVLAAGALPVPGGTEDTLAEETALLGLEGPVVDGLGVLYFPFTPATDGLRVGDGDSDLIKVGLDGISQDVWCCCKYCIGHGS